MPRPLNPKNYHGWRTLVLRRDGYRCVLCGASEKLEVDHIKSYSHYPELCFDLSNGRTLCRECHKKTPTYGGKSRKSMKGKLNGAG